MEKTAPPAGRAEGGTPMAKYSAQISFRSTPEFKQALEKRAKQERMSVSTLILKVMEEYLNRSES